jgi:hypothetical protein
MSQINSWLVLWLFRFEQMNCVFSKR